MAAYIEDDYLMNEEKTGTKLYKINEQLVLDISYDHHREEALSVCRRSLPSNI